MYTKGLIIYIYRERERERERERHDIGVGIDNNGKASMELKEERSSGYLVGKRRYFVLRGLRKKKKTNISKRRYAFYILLHFLA